MKNMLALQPEKEAGKQMEDRRKTPSSGGRRGRPTIDKPMLMQMLKIGGGILPYLAWLVPMMKRKQEKTTALAPLQNFSIELRNDLREDLRAHLMAVREAQLDVTPAIEEQQVRLKKLEEHATELNHSLTNLSEDQLDLADQVRAMAGWVRNSAIAGLFLLALLFVLKLVQAIHH